MRRIPFVACTVLALTLVLSGAATAGIPPGFDEVAIFATNSIDLDRDGSVVGDVVVNDASAATLVPGFELAIDRSTAITGAASADSIELKRGATISEGASCNNGSGVSCTGLGLPVFSMLPAFEQTTVRPDAQNVTVGTGQTVSLTPGEYGDVTIDVFGTLILEGGRYDVRSIGNFASVGGPCPYPCRQILFQAPAEVRVEGKVAIGRDSFVGPQAGSGVDASQIVAYIGGINGTDGGLFSTPAAADIGRDSRIEANLYVANGTLSMGQGTTATGAFLARDVHLSKNSSISLASFFFNRPPTADPQDVFTDGDVDLEIVLTGSDPENDTLIFTIAPGQTIAGTLGPITPIQDPGQCSVAMNACTSDADCAAGETCVLPPINAASVAYNPDGPGNVEDGFFFAVSDPSGGSDDAEVRINSTGDPTDPPPPLGNVVAHPQLRETLLETPILVVLRGSAPCVGECDGLDDVSLNFLPPTGPANGVLSGFTQGSGVPQRTASVTYTPNTGFTGSDSFMFTVEGDTNGDGDTADPGETATATVTIEVEEAAAPTDPTATDVTATVEMDTQVTIPLEGTAGSGGGGGQAPARPAAAPPATSPGAGTGHSSSPGGKVAASRGGFEQSVRLDFGVTPDDFGNTNACVGFNPIFITTQYEQTQSIVFGTAVAFPGFSAPPVSIRSDGAITPPCRSTGEPPFATDWWAEFRVNGGPGAVNSFSVEVGFADAAGDALVDLVAYDGVGNVVDEAFTVATPPTQTLTVSDPDGERSIRFVQVVSSNDPAGLSIDLLDYDDPVEVGSSGCPLTFSVVDPPDNGALGDISQLSDTTAELLFAPNPGFVGTDFFIYRVTDCFGAFADAIVDLIIVDFNDCDDCYTIAVTVDTTKGDVSSNPTGILCGGDCTADFPLGTPVVLQARQIELFVFTSWSGECSGSNPILTVTQANDTSGNGIVECTANFQ